MSSVDGELPSDSKTKRRPRPSKDANIGYVSMPGDAARSIEKPAGTLSPSSSADFSFIFSIDFVLQKPNDRDIAISITGTVDQLVILFPKLSLKFCSLFM